jgi:ribosomal protein L20
VWRSKITCSKECNKVRRSEISRKYWSEVKDGINETRRTGEKPAFIVRYEHKDYSKNTLAQINDAARANGMTYGQMQAYLYSLKHPLITRKRVSL